MKSFTQYVQDSNKDATIVVGRFSVPTTRHECLFETAHKTSLNKNYKIYVLNNSKESILEHSRRVKYIRKMFPRHARSVVLDESINNLFDVLRKLYVEGFINVNLVCEENKVVEYNTLANKYDGHKSRGGFYKFDGGINVISSGILSESLSEEKVLAAAENNDFQTFMKFMPSGFSEAKEMFNDVRKGMGLQESHDFRTHIQLEPVSEEREAYVSGELFNEGDSVVISNTEEVGTIAFLGANYVVVETAEGKRYRKWLSDVERIDESVKTVTFNPVIDRAIDQIVNRKKYANAVKHYMKSKDDLRKISQMFDLDYRTLKKSVDKVLNESVIFEGENVDRVKQQYQDDKDALEDKYRADLEAARRRDEIDAEQERRDQEAENERDDGDDQEQQDESFQSFRSYMMISEVLKKVENPDGKMQWALVSKDDPKKVLQYYDGEGKPPQEWVDRVERRVQYFKHKG